MERIKETLLVCIGFVGLLLLCADSDNTAWFMASKAMGASLIASACLGIRKLDIRPEQ